MCHFLANAAENEEIGVTNEDVEEAVGFGREAVVQSTGDENGENLNYI